MPVFIYEWDALQKIGRIEGADFLRSQSEYKGECSFESFLAEWCGRAISEPDFMDPGYDCGYGISVGGNGAIYGLGGWHRYTVRNTGEILFIKGFCHHQKKCLPLASRVGFRIFPDYP